MNIDKVMALMPTIGHETQAKIRTALEHLVVSSREEAFCEAADAIGGLYSTKPRMSKADIAGMHGTLLGESYGKLSAEQKRANENTGEDASTRKGDGETSNSLGSSSPASPASVPEWVPSADEIQQFIDDGREGDLRALIASRAPLPAPQPSVEYDLYMATNRAAILSETIDSMHKMIETLAEEAGESHGVDEPVKNCAVVSRALAARAKPQPSVEEMAERLRSADFDVFLEGSLRRRDEAYWLTLARAALSADAPENTGEDASTRKGDGETSNSLGSSSPASPASETEDKQP